MKTKECLTLAVALSLAVTGRGAETNAVSTNVVSGAKSETKPKTKPKAPAAKKALVAGKPTAAEQPEPVYNPDPAVARQNNINVRGQASISSEVITHLQKGQPVTVLEEITLRKPKTDEPAKWYRIALPTNAPVWVHAEFIEVTNKMVVPNRLNLRGGPGENYSVLGRLAKGAVVKEIEVRGNWIRIEPPTNSYAFVAAHLLAKLPPPPKTEPTLTPPPETTVAAAPAPKPAVDQPAPVPPTPSPAAIPAPAATRPLITEPPPPAIIEPVTKRIVTREGWVRRTVSPQAPTYFELEARDTKRIVNYLYATSPDVDLKKLKGRLIVVTGEESLDERWPSTPVITVETIEVLF